MRIYWVLMYCFAFGACKYASAQLPQDDWHFTANIGSSLFRHNNNGVGRSEHFRPTFELGLVREVSPDWRLQTGVEWMIDRGDEVSTGNFVNWHIGEIDYRVSENFSFMLYGGMARYYREQSAWGYSKGFGFKYHMQDAFLLSVDFAQAVTDTSDSVPQSPPLTNRDFMRWMSVTLNYQF